MSAGIYKITNLVSNKSYIGKSKNIEYRWQQECTQHTHRAISIALDKYGKDLFKWEIIEIIPLEKYDLLSNERERYWIQYYNTYKEGYNETEGGDGGHPKGFIPKQRKLTIEEIKQIRQIYASETMSRSEAYKLYQDKIQEGTFEKIWYGYSYPEIMPEVYNQKRKIIKPSNKNNAKLTSDQVREIRDKYDQQTKKNKAILAREYRVSWSTINKIVTRQSWIEV